MIVSKISHPRNKHRKDLGLCSCISIRYICFRKVNQMTERKKYKKVSSGIIQARVRLGGESLHSWNRCESG